MRTSALSSILALGTATLLTACGGGGNAQCEKLYAAEKKCEKDFDMPKGTFMKVCEAAMSDPEAKAEIASAAKCAAEATCEAKDACEQAARGAERAKEVGEQLAAGKLKDAFDDCTLNAEYYAAPEFKSACTKVMADAPTKLAGKDLEDALVRCRYSDELAKIPEVKAACGAMATAELTRQVAAATKARDAGTNDFGLCLKLQDLVKEAGSDPKAIEVLCKEMEVAESARKGAEEARANAAAKSASLPYQCTATAEDLTALGTEWSKKAQADLDKACYVDLGLVVFELKSGEAQVGCPYEIMQVLEGATKRGVAAAFPEFAAAVAKLPKTCKQ
jgi:hypothetical protein